MPTVKATGQISIIDYNDAISLSGYIGSNHAKYQIYSSDSGDFTPDWSTNNLVLTPELYVTSTTSDVIGTSAVQSVSWYRDNDTTAITSGATYGLSGANNQILTVKTNILTTNASSTTFKCVVEYLDSTTNLTLTEKMDISFALVSSGSGIADALANTPNGNVFKNSSVASLTAECYLWEGSTQKTSGVTYQWYIQDGTSTDDSSIIGNGWKRLTNHMTPTYQEDLYNGVTTSTITIYSQAVPSLATFACVITDTDSGNHFKDYVTFVDLSDPIQVTVESSGGDIFKNGVGSTVLTARLFQAGAEIDATSPYTYTYKWYKYDNSATLDPNFGGTGVSYKTGKNLTVVSSDVNIKATFKVEVE